MKSKKAEAYMDSKVEEVDDVVKFGTPKFVIRLHNAIYSVELAEQDAEERMRRKALAAFDDMWFENGETGEFEPDYEYHRRNFIKKLNEE